MNFYNKHNFKNFFIGFFSETHGRINFETMKYCSD